jgi:hypothetical protein
MTCSSQKNKGDGKAGPGMVPRAHGRHRDKRDFFLLFPIDPTTPLQGQEEKAGCFMTRM